MRRLAAVAVLATLVATAGMPITCAGWEPRAADRMACCQRAHHAECDDQAAADSCCGRQEHAQHAVASLAGTSFVPAPVHGLATPAFTDATAPLPSIARLTRSHSRPAHDPPNLSPPPLRI